MFKINISHKGKTLKIETESETPVGKAIGEKIKGEDISADLDGYELEITGTSDLSGFPGQKGLEGAGYHRELLTHGFGMKNTKKGLRLRKTLRGQEISLKTSQINIKVIKEGKNKFETLMPRKEIKINNASTQETEQTEAQVNEEKRDTNKKEEKPADQKPESKAEKTEEKQE